MRPKVASVLTRFGAGGPPIQAVLLMKEMRKRGFETRLVAGRCGEGEVDMSYLLEPGDRVEWIPELERRVSPWRDLVAFFRLYAYLRRERPDIVHTHTAKAGALGRLAARLAGVPAVVHTYHGNVLQGYFGRAAAAAVLRAERILGAMTDVLCALSPQQAAELADGFHVAPRGKFRVVPFGLDLEPYASIPAAPGGGQLVAGWLGRLAPVKNVPLLVSTIQETARTERVVFVIAGDGPDRPLVERAAARLGPERVRFLGWRRDVTPVIAQCHVLIQTSKNEGTPVALIQGMAAGRPFVSTPAGGVVDMVAGTARPLTAFARWFDNGILAEPDPAAFASALEALAAQREAVAAMGRSAAAFARRHYSLHALTGALEEIYRGLLAPPEDGRVLCTR